MAFEDSLIGSDDFDPRAATEALIRSTSAEPLPENLDPRMLNTRLARKLAQPGALPVPVDLEQPSAKQPEGPLDFSSQAVEPTTPNTSADFSAQAVEPATIGPQAKPASNNTVGTYATEFGKGVAEGAKNMGASALKGAAAVGIPSMADPTLLDELAASKDLTPAARAKLTGRALRTITDRGLQMDFSAAVRRIADGADAAKEVETLRKKFEANNTAAKQPVTEKPLYKAGQAVEDFGKEALAPAPGFENSWTRDIGSGAGSMAAGIAASMIPGIGPTLAGTIFTAAGAGEATDRAVKGGADNDTIRRAAMLGGAAGATDLVDALIPMLGSTGRALGFLKRVGLAAVKGAIMEGGQEGVQQLMQNAIAQGLYKPDQDLFEDVPRSVAIAAILGGAGGGISGAASRGRADEGQPGLPPPPGGSAAPGAGPSPSGPSSPEDIADFVRRAREGAPPQPEAAAPQSERDRMDAYMAAREAQGGASEEEILRKAGLDPATMDEQERIDAVIRSASGEKPAGERPASGPDTGPEQEGLKPKPREESHLRYAVLREYGYSDEDIDAMPEAQRKREFADAIAEGVLPGKAMSKHKPRAKPAEPATESDVGAPNKASDLPGAFASMGKGMGDALRDKLWSRVQAGETSEGSGMGTSALMQGAKMIRERGGLQTREEFDAYAAEQANLQPGTPDFQQGMRALVGKYAKNDTGQNVPESRRTLKEQQNQLIKGERDVQMFPKGTREFPLPPGMQRVETERGIFHFNPKKITADKITAASAAGRENELLGLGSLSKEDVAKGQGEERTVVERTPDGTEVRAAAGRESTVEQQLAEMEKGKSPGNTVAVETPQETLDRRNGTGTRAEPIDIKTARDVERAAAAGAADYTHAQGEANNRKLGHAKWNGLPVSLEVAKGGARKMVNPETGEGVDVTHAGAAYGYFPGTKGADGMHVDVYMGEHPESPSVFVIDEIDRDTKKFRQHKVMAGFASERDAFAAYIQTSTKGPETVGSITTMTVGDLKDWLASGDTTKALKPASPGPDKTDEAGSAALTKPAEGDSTDTKGSPDASRGGGGGVRPETTIPGEAESFGQKGGNPGNISSGKVGNQADEPLNLLQFIASRGGLRPDPELSAIGLSGDHRVQIPGRKGFFGVTKATGDSLDNMREAAEEAGYLRGEHNKTSTVRDLLDAIDTELRGGHHRAEGEEGKHSKRQRQSLTEASNAARDKAIVENVETIQAEYTDLPEGLAERAATIMADEMVDLDTAVELAAVREINEDPDYEISENDITATYGEGAFDALQTTGASDDGRVAAPAGDQEQRPEESEEAGEDGEPDAATREEGGEAQIARPYPYTADRTQPTQIVPLPMELEEFQEITDEWSALFSDPDQRVNLETKFKNGPFLPLEEAQARIEQWRADAIAQGGGEGYNAENFKYTILSLYDLTGNWSRPWAEAGYNVLTFDLQAGYDVNDFSAEYFTDNFNITDVYGILIAQPCTDFAVSGAKHFAAKDARGDTAKSVELVHQSLRTVEYFRPKFWALENPVSRIEKLTGLPKWRLLFNPNNFGDPYTKKTVLWGQFEEDLPTANVEPTEGSKMHTKYGGKSQATKNARSETPEGFSYAFFKANNRMDKKPLTRLLEDYPEVSGAVRAAFNAGVSEARINELMEDTYDDYEYDAARDALIAAAHGVNLPAPREQLFVEIAGKRMPLTSFEDASRAYSEAVEQTGATSSGRTGPEAPRPLIKNEKGETVGWISYNGRVWKGDPDNFDNTKTELLYDPQGEEDPYARARITDTRQLQQTEMPGTERIGQGEQAQRAIEQGLKPKVAQRPADEGLFGDEMNQRDLLDATRVTGIEAHLQGREPETYRQVMQAGTPKEAFELFTRAAKDHPDDSGVIDRLRRVIRTMRSPTAGMLDLETALMQLRGTMDYIDEQNAEERSSRIAGEVIPDLDGASVEMQAGDTDDTVTVTLSRQGPWDFNDTWPAPDVNQVRALDKEGRDPFGDGYDVENVVAMLDEGMHGITSAIAEIRHIDKQIADIQSGKTKLKRNQTPQDAIDALNSRRGVFAAEVRDTAAAYEDLFGRPAANAMIAESRRRLRNEESQRDPGAAVARAPLDRIEAVLGDDADRVAPVDIARAAEIMADNPGMEPETAFGQAVVVNAVEQGFITEQEATEAYGPEVQELLESSREGASLRGGNLEQEGAEPDQIGPGDTAEAGVVPGSGEAGPAEGRADSVPQDAERDDAGRGQPDAERAAGGEAADQGAGAAEGSDDALVASQNEPTIQAGETDGVPASVPTGNAPAGASDVQPAQPGGQADGLRGREGSGSKQAVPRADSERAEGAGRVSPRARGQRSDRASDGGDAGLPGARDDNAASGRAKRAAERAADHVEGENYTIEPGALDEGRGQKTKAIANLNAIELANQLVAEGRPATRAEQDILAKYVGWGGIKNVFPDTSGGYPDDTFATLGERLKAALTEDEYVTARRSIQYAHYTAEDVVRAMWSAVAKMGFAEGQVFEPGMGVGNFAGMMPGDIATNAHYQGIELDHVTARIAKLLYPKYGVRQEDFTKTVLPADTFDLVIGNPPFADVAIKSDPKYRQGFLLHDYFFAKSLDAVRPGGLLAFVTSAGTMNKIDTAAREYLADRADFVGGIRLPGNAFKQNAGTEVTTDILFLRKRLPGDIAGDRSWTETTVVELPGPEGTPVKGNVNRYFAENPEMVLGKGDFADKLYQGRYSVKAVPGSDFKADLTAAIGRLPADIMKPWQDAKADNTEHDFDATEKKEGTYYVGPKGELYQMASGVGRPVGKRGKGVEGGRTAADIERIEALIPVRDALRAVYAADLKGDTGNAERARQQLNKSYDAFVAKHGPINKAVIQTRRPNVIQMEAARAEAREEARYAGEVFKEGSFDATPLLEAKTAMSVIARERQAMRDEYAKKGLTFDEGSFDPDEVPDIILDKRPNVEPFMDDPESYRLRAIERYDEGTGQGHKSPVFFENVISRETPPKISSVNDALLYSLSQYGRVNIPEMARLSKMSDDEVIEKLGEQVFRTPGTKDTYVTRDEYLSGNVRKKLALAQAAAEKNPDFRRNVTALEAAQPMPLAPSQIHASLGMPWIPAQHIEAFGKEELGLESLKVRYFKALAQWTVSGDTDSVAATSTWGTENRRAPALIQDALNRSNPKIYDKVYVDGKEQSILNVAKTEAAQDKVRAIQEKFAEWIWADEARADKLANFYNENFNNLVVRQYDGEYLTTPGIASSWSWRPHQKRVIARIIQSGNTYIAHAVGAGKTSEYIGAIMEMRRLGLVRKPMVAVPNHMLQQFTKEWYEQYPTARLAIADDKRFHTDRRKQFVANVALDDLDAVIITHSAFKMIPVSAEFSNSLIQREIVQYRELLADLKGTDTRITRSRVEKQIERLEQRLQGKNTGRRDAVFTFEEMGIDHLTIDEAHLFRKLDFTTTMSNLKGISPDGSDMGWDLYVKAQYLNTIRPGRGLLMGSGTPITNTMAELYSLSRFMQPEALAERGLEKFDAWAGAFGESVSELEQDAAGNYKPVSRFAKFVNVAELSAMVRQVMDVVTSKQLEQYVTRPKLKGGKRNMVLAEKSHALVRYQENLAARMKAISERKGPPKKGDDILLSVINDGRHAAIDMRLAGGDQTSEPSKLDLMIDNVFNTWAASKKQKFYKVKPGGGYEDKPAMSGPATQLIFVNLGLSGARGFSVPDYIRAELHRRGVPKNEIAYIYDFKSATAKQRLFNDMNEGKVRILLGSVAKMGVGTNVQRRLLAIHNMDPLWYPADDEQRNGRGIRQGNMNPEIEINDYSTKGTYDSTMWGMMAKKAKFIEGFFEGDPSLRDMEDLGESSQYEQAKALTTNDPRLIRFTELKQELERATRRKTAFESEIYNTRQRRARAKSEIEHYTKRIAETKLDIKQRIPTTGELFKGTVGKTEFDNRPDFGVALFERLEELEKKGLLGGAVRVAEVGGFPIYAQVRKGNLDASQTTADVYMAINGDHTRDVSYDTSSLGTVRSIENILRNFENDLEEYQHRLAKQEKFFADSADKVQAKFQGQAEIERLQGEVNALANELAAKPADTVTQQQATDIAQLADASYGEGYTPLAHEKIAKIEQMLTNVVRSIAGDIKLEFHKGMIPVQAPPGYPAGKMRPVAAGVYSLGGRLMRLALLDNADKMMTAAFHESYHRVEDQLQSKAERELMEAETPRLREWLKGKINLSDDVIDQLAGFEIRAMAFQTYANQRMADNKDAGRGIHVGVRRWFDRLIDLLRKIVNGLKGLGFQTYNDVFSDAYTGEFAKRTPLPEGYSNIAADNDLAALSDVVAGVADRINNRFGERFTELRVRLQDRFLRLKKVQDSFGSTPTSQDTYQAEMLMPGRTGQRLEALEKEKFEPLIEMMSERDVSLEEMSEYLYAKHAPERNRAMDEINHPELMPGGRDLRGRGSGMSDDEAAEIMDRIRNGNRMADFEAVEALVRDIQQNTVDTLVSYGLISDETAAAWAAQYDYYVPLQGFDEGMEDDALFGLRGPGLDTRAREVKQAFGRLSKAAGPLPYILMQAEMAIVRGEKNKVGNTALRFFRAHPDPRRWTIDTPKQKKAIDPYTGLVTMVTDNNWYNDPNVFVTKIGGQRIILRFEGTEGRNIARALKNMGVENLGDFMRFMRLMTTTMARLSTQWNPNFVLPNLVRDLGEAYINMQEQDQAHFVKQFTKHLIPAIGGSFQALRGQAGGRYAAAFREYDAAGGRVRFFGLDNAVDVESRMRRQMRRLEGGPINSLRDAAEEMASGFDAINGAMENATRLAAYMAARDVGMSIPNAASLALNLTVNFTKRGELGAHINALYMFANAAMQGGRRTFSALKNKNVRRGSYALIALGALSAMLAYGAGGDDDSGESYYHKVPDWERDKNLIIMWPKGYGKDGGYIKIPLPFLFGSLKVLGDRLVGVALGKDKVTDAAAAVLKAFADGLNPLGEESASIFSLFPTVARPALHIAANKNWNGREIFPTRDFEKSKPDSEQYFSTTPKYAKVAAREINRATGGNPYKSGGLDWHPGSIQHVIESLTGGLGKFVTDVMNTGGSIAKGEGVDVTKAPVLRRFVGSANSEQADSSRYYADREEARKSGEGPIQNARRDRAKGINKAEADSFLKDNQNSIRGERIFKAADEAMKPLRDRKNRIEASDSFGEAERKEVESIKQRMRDIQNRARKQYRELKAGAS